MKPHFRLYKILFVGLLLSTLLIAGQVLAAPTVQGTATAVVNTGALNVRFGPAPTYSIVTSVRLDDTVTLLGRIPDNVWVKVQTASGHQGWVNARYLVANTNLGSLPIVSTPLTPGNEPGGVVSSGNLNVRSGPNVAYPPITVITHGQFVAITGRNYNASWVRIRTTTGHEGWVNSAYLTTSISVGDLPIVDTPEATTPTATVIATYLNMRSGPSPEYEVVGSLDYGNQLTLLSRNADGSWVNVQSASGYQGWVNSAYIVAGVPVGSLPAGQSPAQPATGPAAMVTANYLNVRLGPGLQHAVITSVTYGEAINLLGRDSYTTWVKVQTPNGAVGWVNSDYTQPNVNINTLPVVDTNAMGSATVTTNYLNVRWGPGTGYGIAITLNYAQNMSLLGRNADGTWLKVQTANGTIGWVSSAYVQTTTAVSNLSVTN